MKLGVVVFNFQGGEPFLPELSSYLEEIIKAVKPNRNLINITTNGTLLDERKIKRIKELGVDKLVFSLDSGIAEEHDKFRGVRNTFNRATKNIDLALKNGLRVAINTTLTHQSLYSDGFKKLIEFAEKRNIFVNTIFPAPVGAWEGNMKIVLTKTDTAYINKLRKEHPLLRRDVDSTFVKWGCLAVKEAVYITAYGDVLACPFIHISLGNIFQDSLDKIRKRGLKIKFFDHYDKKCFASENYEFMKKYLSYTKGKELPMDYSQVKEWWCS